MTARPRRQRWRASNPSNPEGFRNDRGRGKGRIAAPSERLEAFARTLRICGCASERACMCTKGRITFPTLPFYKLSIKEYSLFNNLYELFERKGLTKNLPHSFRSRKGVLGGRAAWSFRAGRRGNVATRRHSVAPQDVVTAGYGGFVSTLRLSVETRRSSGGAGLRACAWRRTIKGGTAGYSSSYGGLAVNPP